MKKYFFMIFVVITCLLTFVGCAKKGDNANTISNIPTYERIEVSFCLADNANTYKLVYADEGVFYYSMFYGDADANDEDVPVENRFYYKKYGSGEEVLKGTIFDGAVRDMSYIYGNDSVKLVVLHTGEETCIYEFDEVGNIYKKIALDSSFNDFNQGLCLLPVSDEKFIVSRGNELFFIDSNAQVIGSASIEGNVSSLIAAKNNEIYAITDKNTQYGYEKHVCKIDIRNMCVTDDEVLANDVIGCFAYEDGLALVYSGKISIFHIGQEDEKDIIDLNVLNLISSEIVHIFTDNDEIKIVSMNSENTGVFVSLKEKSVGSTDSSSQNDSDLYTQDGKRIVHVVVPEDYIFKIDFHAKKYNQVSNDTYVQIEYLNESLELYLGKGNQPDVIMFANHTEVQPYIEKDLLVDFTPYFEGQDEYSLDDIVPQVKEILCDNDSDAIYGMSGSFRLLMMVSDGTEFDETGKCDAYEYLKWYDQFLTDNNMSGFGDMYSLLYTNIGEFYDETKDEAYFTSNEFKQFMELYKDIYSKHVGEIDTAGMWSNYSDTNVEIYRGAFWRVGFGVSALADEGTRMTGIPTIDGQAQVLMMVDCPMGIMSTSDCKQEAFDFIMYYSSLENYLMKGESESDYGKNGMTIARLSTYSRVLDSLIFECEKPFYSRYIGDTGFTEECFFTDDNKANLREMIDCAVSDTKSRRDIYVMFEEEMDAYLNGSKDLDSVCSILQSRASLYLQEHSF